jgi:hypothetical protein
MEQFNLVQGNRMMAFRISALVWLREYNVAKFGRT